LYSGFSKLLKEFRQSFQVPIPGEILNVNFRRPFPGNQRAQIHTSHPLFLALPRQLQIIQRIYRFSMTLWVAMAKTATAHGN